MQESGSGPDADRRFVLAKLEEKGWKLQPEADRRHVDPPRLSRPDRPAADARRSEGIPRGRIPECLRESCWTDCSRRRTMASNGAATGSTSRAIPIPSATPATANAKSPGSIATTSSMRSTRTSRTTGSSLEQLAGDQLVNYKPGSRPTPEEIEPLTATGFLRTTADITDNQTIYEVDKYFDALEKAMETSLKARDGPDVQCARCHDHKFDPILQKDYYKLTSVFQAVWDPENWLAAQYPFRRMAEPHGARHGARASAKRGSRKSPATARSSTAVSNSCIAATYDRYRTRNQGRASRLPTEERDVIRKEIEADPDLDVDPKAPNVRHHGRRAGEAFS